MTIVGMRYRAAELTRVPVRMRWWALARHEYFSMFRSRMGIAMFCACLLPLIVRLFVLMIRFGVVNFGSAPRNRVVAHSQAMGQWDPMLPDFYVEMVVGTWPGLPILVILTAALTAGTVAADRRTNALELLWTRGITPFGYILSKWFGSLLLVSTITVVAPFVLWCFAVSMAPDWQLLESTIAFVPAALGGLLLVTGIWTALCILISVLASTPHQAIVVWLMILVGSGGIGAVASRVFRAPSIQSWLSVWDAGGTLARELAGAMTRGSLPGAISFLGVLLVMLAVFAVRRMRLSEAMG